MEDVENISNCTSMVEGRIPFSLNFDDKQTVVDSYVKVNGDHNVPQNIFPSDDDSSTSSSSSSSPRNLIIDHPEEMAKDDVEEDKKTRPQPEIQLEQQEEEQLEQQENEQQLQPPPPPPPQQQQQLPEPDISQPKKSLKRKLSLRDMTNPYLPKKRRHSTKSVDTNLSDRQQLSIGSQLAELCPTKSELLPPFQNYTNYLGLKPALPIKCFKCSNSNFGTLSELRDHQKICLFRDKQRNLPNSIDAKLSSTINNNNTTNIDEAPTLICDGTSKLPTPLPIGLTNNSIAASELATTAATATAKVKKRVFLCSACGTYYENWNLFLHMREVHKRHICLYCIGMFPTAERLTFHLEMKHDLEQNHFDCQENLLRASRDSCYLMCCVCEHLFTEHDDFSDHKCSDHIQPCSLCGLKGKHVADCKAALQTHRAKHRDHMSKRKNRNNQKSILGLGAMLEGYAAESTLNGNKQEETSILRQIITDPDRIRRNDNGVSSPVKLNGCTGDLELGTIENGLVANRPVVPSQPENSAGYFGNVFVQYGKSPMDQLSQDAMLQNKVIASDIPRDTDPDPPPEFNQSAEYKGNEIDTSQSNTTSDLTLSSPSTSERALNDSSTTKSNEDSQQVSGEAPSQPLFVPKFTIKIPKEYQAPIESEQSSTESDENEMDREENAEESNSDMDLEEPIHEPECKENISQTSDICDNAENEAVTLEKTEAEDTNQTPEETEKTNVDVDSHPEMEKPKSVYTSNDDNEEKLEVDFVEEESAKEKEREVPADGIMVADEDVLLQDLLLDRALDRINIIEFMRICMQATMRTCLYCNHARSIAVNANSYALHLISDHRFSATVDSITAEELQPATIVLKLKSFLPELESIYFNLATYCSDDKENNKPYEKTFECFQCRFQTRIHKELYLHNRKMHLKTAILCFMCRHNFFSYSEILCHMCPGVANKCVIFDVKFRCCLCDLDNIPSAFRLMVHLRKRHFACDVCLEDCYDQSRLSSHVWKHKLHHLCYRCGIAYRNKPDITKHLFWKHGTESVLCKRCLQKRWPHVYHFCIPPTAFICEVCNQSFSKSMALKVHRRLHTGDAPYPCPEDECDQKFISRKLLLKHSTHHNEVAEIKEEKTEEEEFKPIVDEQLPEMAKDENENTQAETVEETEEKVKEETETKAEEQSKRKRKKSKKNKGNLDDLMDLPAPNLSESDSSDESDCGRSRSEKLTTPIAEPMLSPPSETEVDTTETINATETAAGTEIMDIWENFKSFQASQAVKAADNDSDDDNDRDPPAPPILHVTQSDHDYCLMFKPISSSKDDITEVKGDGVLNRSDHSSPKKKQKSPRKAPRSVSESSSSGSSSSSDSSCSCGSNCSCTSSSGSSSDSSSSSDSESSSSEGQKRSEARRLAKLEKKNRSKAAAAAADESIVQDAEMQSPKANSSDIVDVVTTDSKPQIDPSSIILESDLETDETETDEDFYDEHPQKLANQLLAEKRKQLLMQTSLSPSHNFDIVENSRPSTPSIPEEMIKEKKVKIKKRKREKKLTKLSSGSIAPLKPIIPQHLFNVPMNSVNLSMSEFHEPPNIAILSASAPLPDDLMQPSIPIPTEPPIQSQLPPTITTTSPLMPAPIAQKSRLSTGSSSDPDASLKRSKRRRRPNKFYGYTSDDDMNAAMTLTGPAAFKPTPPPNLTWRKEDLPAPASKTTHHRKSSSGGAGKKSATASINTAPPPIPPIIIRPKKTLSVDSAQYKPPIVQPTVRVPPVPVHHIRPPQYSSPSGPFDDSGSSSDDSNRLTIMTTAGKKRAKGQGRQRKLKQPPHHQQSQQQQQQQHQQQPQQMQMYQYETPQQPPPPPPVPIVAPPPQPPVSNRRIPPALLPNPDAVTLEYFKRNSIRYPIQPPAGARPPREGESVYCYCRCPYDEVSEMIACDGDNCIIEWFHFECVGILIAPQGKWFCPECRSLYSNETAAITGMDISSQ